MQFCYALVDTMFIARIDPSSTAIISGTGLMFPLFFLFMALSMSLSIGVSALVGRVIGQNNRELASHVMPSALLISLSFAVPALLAGYLFSHSFIHFLAGDKLSAEAIGYGMTFFSWLLPGMAVMLFGNVFTGILKGEGQTKRIAIAMTISTIMNIILDPVFIFGCKMGVAGAGLATSLSVLTVTIIMIIAFRNDKSSFQFSANLFKSKWSVMTEIIKIGFPNFLSMAALAISFIVFNKVVSSIGQVYMNAWTLVGRMDQIVLIPSFAVAGATVTMIAQNYGRGNMERVRKIYLHNVVLAMILVGCAALVYVISAPYFFRLFTNVKEVLDFATLQVRVMAFTFVALSAVIVSTSTFQATRKPLPALFFALIRMGLISIPISLVLVFVLHLKMWGVYLALGFGNLWAFPIAFFWTKRHLGKLTEKKD